jgi:Domain of unknown function (DUF6285)
MQPRPNNPELAGAVREFLESEILPTLSDARLKFRTLVAMNALSMLERSELEEDFLRAEVRQLAVLLGEITPICATRAELDAAVWRLNQTLAGRVRQNQSPDGALEVLRQIAVNKLKIASPNYLKRYAVP